MTRLTDIGQCLNCTPGFYCGETNLTHPSGPCQAGYYCPLGSDRATAVDCPQGHFCNGSNAVPNPCPKGTYSDQTNLLSVSDCDACPGGYYCETDGLSTPTGPCGEGYYCPEGSIYKEPPTTYCTIGHFCPEGSSQPLPCRNNSHVNHTHAIQCYACPAGFYCEVSGMSIVCPKGYYCPAGTGLDWQVCPRGTYSDMIGLYDESQCKPCSAGKYCDGEHLTAETGDCAPGYWCLSGVDRAYPGGSNQSTVLNNTCYDDRMVGTGGRCPVGFYCPGGLSSIFPTPCDNGTYSDSEGLSTCKDCPEGYYCPLGTANYTDYPCPVGHYCPKKTKWWNQYPCGVGTFNNLTARTKATDCLACPGGQFCAQTGLLAPSGYCSAGYYCSGSSATAMPTGGSAGGKCQEGYYCPLGAYQPILCDPGSYCAGPGLSNVSGLCLPGYYCSAGARVPNPVDGNITGNICPKGAFCPEGSLAPHLCPPGTYLNSTGSSDISHCLDCTAGFFCDGSGKILPDGPCAAGYYCPGRQEAAAPLGLNCTLGHYCPAGSSYPIGCASGSYQDEYGQARCKSCPPGYFCDGTTEPVVMYNNSACPRGFYCPQNSTRGNEFPCPAGTYNNLTHRTSLVDCQFCPGGDYCDQNGLAVPTGKCSAGYYCTLGANSSTPLQGTSANICPKGFYCIEGSAAPVSCPLGTYNPSVGRHSVDECTNCSGGRYCPYYNMSSPGPFCEPGYYCPGGADVSNYLRCTEGSYCPEGSDRPTSCPAGTFSGMAGLGNVSECSNCTGGFYCPDPGQTKPGAECWGGYYCPGGMAVPNPVQYLCPKGLHCPNGSEIYKECSDGSYTSTSGQASCEICPQGSYCLPVTPNNASLGIKACPQGYYCPLSTGSDWISCPSGTYSNATGLRDASQCLPCSSGQFCMGEHLISPTGTCAAGYYCTSGVDRPMPGAANNTGSINCTCPVTALHTGVGGICPLGHYCPTGSGLPVPCVPGTYADKEGLVACLTCPKGFFCLSNATQFLTSRCPVGHYCPNGTQYSTEWECPPGTYNPTLGASSEGDCLPCPGGLYCAGRGNFQPSGNCSAGWYCSGRSDSPNTTTFGGKCRSGYYCPEGSSDPQPCPGGQYCQIDGLSQPSGNCSAGYYCILRASESAPVDGITGAICPAGFYCPQGSASPLPCSPGTYSPSNRNTQASNCIICTAGEYCVSYNLTSTTGNCTAGYFCPSGESAPALFECTVGHYCPERSSSPVLCPSGWYQDETRQPSCKMCPPGYYCDNSNGMVIINDTVKCPEGHYCPAGTMQKDQYPCPVGTFSSLTGLNHSSQCSACSGGRYCDQVGLAQPSGLCHPGYFCKRYAMYSTPNQTGNADICPQGFYCEEGTVDPKACPPGTFGSTVGLPNITECTPCSPGYYCQTPGLTNSEGLCSAGYFCTEGSNSSSSELCPVGAFCPKGTGVPKRCPVGTFSPYHGLNSSDFCTPCTPGQYCGEEGLNVTSGPCEPGYFCPAGQNSSRPADFACPVGHYCPLNSSQSLPCPSGTYMNHTVASECDVCSAGWYCLGGNLVQKCPAGHFCPEGTGVDWQPCPLGTFSNQTGLSLENQCSSCLGGQYCGQPALTWPSGFCQSGYYCEYGVDRAKPVGNSSVLANGSCVMPGGQTGSGGLCPVGYYCPQGTTHPQPCGAGSYSNISGLPSCLPCPAGYYCLQGAITYINFPCPSGHYCPEGTSSATQFPCPAKTFFNLTTASSILDCIPCPGGSYCQTDGLSDPTGLCSAGWYCSSNSSSPTPSASEGGECRPGFYCPLGSQGPEPCDPGRYCQTAGLASPSGLCSAGYFCSLQANISMPTDGMTGNICPVGYYCPQGSSVAVPCDMGYYLDVTQQDSASDCKLCTAGKFCPGQGREHPAGNCDAGYFCPGGQNTSAPHSLNCPVGHYCPAGSVAPVRCENGTYQDQETQATCKTCPAGYVCDNTMNIVVLDNTTTLCPKGSYCPAATRFATQFLCPIGTFSNSTGLKSVSECSPCPGGLYCPVPGINSPKDLCDAGYFCKQHANISAPDQGTDANICPEGHYCLAGSSAPSKCPKGTFSNKTGLRNESECVLCPAGSYCAEMGLTAVSGPCQAGFYCELGSNQSQDHICPVGHYCGKGSAVPSPCAAGTYSNTEGLTAAANCTQCDPGKYCNATGLSSPVAVCDAGFYCPGGNTVPNPVATPCPVGLHCPAGSSGPQPCSPGYFTNFSHAAFCLECIAGFYCVPEEVVAGISTAGYRLCPEGFFCPAGTGRNWTACPVGTFSNVKGLANASECQLCSGGFYCDRTNLTAPSGPCSQGFYCTMGVNIPTPGTGYTGVGGICPAGYKCPAQSTVPTGCEPGTYQDQTNQGSCKVCPAGYYCLSNSTAYADKVCPSGHYCPNGTQFEKQFPCPAGKFNNLTGQASVDGCTTCTAGYYCASSGLSQPTGPCDAGWYCYLGATLSTPSPPQGGKCLAGTYCPLGSSEPTGCDFGQYCDADAMYTPRGPCMAGFYCNGNSTTDQPTGTGGNRCPRGYYCEAGTWSPKPCPPGYYQPSEGAQNISWCVLCTAGSYCNQSGLPSPDGLCDPGYYCPQGQMVRNPSLYQCPAGYYCLAGSSNGTLCTSGMYQDEMRQSTCKECPKGFYCDNSVGVIILYSLYQCPVGHYCVNGTKVSSQYPCPAGTFNNNTGLGSASDCLPCLGGFYCPSGTVYPSLPCSAGYYCHSNARTAAPQQGADADKCPAGHYCPERTTEPLKCPPGTFSNNTQLMYITDCTPCTQGYYCDSYGLTKPAGLCSAGYYCVQGSNMSAPEICPAGRYCPTGTYTPARCPAGTYSNATGLSSANQCTNCTAGYYCQNTGLVSEQGQCLAGYYCPSGSVVPNSVICPVGQYCPEGSSKPLSCAPGYYTNRTGMSACDICPDGYYCLPVAFGEARPGYYSCPAGFYCANGTGMNWQPCPRGTYSKQLRLYRVNQCTDCDGGYYCGVENATAPTGQCRAGYYCQSGVDRPNPDNSALNISYPPDCPLLGGHTGYGSVCPRGHRCPVGTEMPQGCAAGTYQDEEAQSTCKTCPAGYYCLSNATDYASSPCPAGDYCPPGTTRGDEFKCPVGTFNPALAQTNTTACLLCTPGMYCQTQGLASPTANCSQGWYCIRGATQATPTDSNQGGRCRSGTYCPQGSKNYTECDGGKYCQLEGLAQPSGNCSPGFYCVKGAFLPKPSDGTTGGECPAGYFCPEGSNYPLPCPMGYYLDTTRSSVLSACKICTPGKYCKQEGLSTPTGYCSPGYYCPAGQSSGTPGNYSCPEGYFCLNGSKAPEPCPSGTYQTRSGQSYCDTCPAGYYCNATSSPVVYYGSYICPVGYYCPNGTQHAEQFPCPVGTFNNLTGLTKSLDCTDCVGGMACDQKGLMYPLRPCSPGYYCRRAANTATPTQGANADKCPLGSYCPERTAEPLPCPQGTYNPQSLKTNISDCLACTAGYYCNQTGLAAVVGKCQAGFYCPAGAQQSTEVVCPQGMYCPQGSAVPTGCPNGTYSNQTGLTAAVACTPCLKGYYCNGFGLTTVSGPCRSGYYCPANSSVENQVVCPAARYCPQGSAEPQKCPAGYYVDYSGASTCLPCPAGYYCIPELTVQGVPSSSKALCPKGFFCPNGTGYDWQSCPAGTYSNITGLGQATQCTPCLAGFYCQGSNLTSPTGICQEGYYCISGADRGNPVMLNNTQCPTDTVYPIIGNICPAGHYCPKGTKFPIGCPPGTYQDLTNQKDCKSCPAGYFCPANTSDYSTNVCPGGYYCPMNTTDQYQHACGPGTFNNLTQQKDAGACVSCSPGMFCQGSGNSAPTGNCSAGWYCSGGSSQVRPSSNGSQCQAGNYCPIGSSAMVKCTAGYYCNSSGLSTPTGLCKAGYYCPLGSASATQVDCPVGSYCREGTDVPVPCRNGTYGPVKRLASEGECIPCDGGRYCNGTGLSSVSGSCWSGYYCPSGQAVPNPYAYLCLKGHYCLNGTAIPSRCRSGFYQDELGQASCKICPEGYFCDSTLAPIGDLGSYGCPAGYYCPNQTERFNQHPCLPGTFGNLTNRVSQTDCQACTPGYYCQSSGLAQPEGLCFAGFYCEGGNSHPNPSNTICPIGNYCPEGSYKPTPCPEGTLATSEGNSNMTDCEPCKPGTYCLPESSRNGTSLPCQAGYICLSGSNIPNPTNGILGYICPAGHYCPSGAVVEIPCDKGLYAPVKGLGTCLVCPVGTSCPTQGMNDTLPCPAGYYCRNGTGGSGVPCPTGTYNPNTGLSLASQCLGCPPGKFCNRTGLDTPSGDCLPGFLCVGNATHPAPNDGINMPCPAGRYCPAGTVTALLCPEGTMRNQTGGGSVMDCWPCKAGYYCELQGALGPSGECQERYYCPDIAEIQSPTPSTHLCPPGFYCPKQTGDPFPCPPGTYQDSSGSVSCLPCPGGSYCPSNTSTPLACPPYSYCPNSTAEPMLCPNGTYTDDVTTGLMSPGECPLCVAGKYCVGGRIAGDCAAGYYCNVGMDLPNPDNSYAPKGSLCPYGRFCPAGTTKPEVCPLLKFIDKEGAADVSDCQPCPAGRVCPQNSTISEPCYRGYYCLTSKDPVACPVTTYNDEEGATGASYCKPCPSGFICDEVAVTNYTSKPCPVGSYCVNASSSAIVCPPGTYRDVPMGGTIDDCFLCPAGFYCPVSNMTYSGIQCDHGMTCPPGSQSQTVCAAGYYCNMSMGQVPCPPGYYCPQASSFPIRCPQGHYCGSIDDCNVTSAGAIEPLKCPLGYKEYDGSPRHTFNDTCEPCLPGTYGADPNRTLCMPCRAGVVCLAGATTDNPVSNSSSWASVLGVNATNSYLCPPGYYCPENSSEPTPCPAGRYNPEEEAGSISECLPCPVDHYSPYSAQTHCFICGGEATQPGKGQTTCQCIGAGRDFQLSDKTCPCLPGYVDKGEQDCVKTIYNLCGEGQYRYQDGRCLNEADFVTLCTQSVCASPADYTGYDRLLGLCLCKVEDLEEVCNLECRRKSRYRLTFVCAASPNVPYLNFRDSSNNTVKQIPTASSLSIINARNAITAEQCDSLDNSETSISIVETSQDGFLGVYNPDTTQLVNLVEENTKGSYAGNSTSGFTFSRRRLLSTSSVNGSIFSGITNPTTCLEYGQLMFFSVSNTYYPVYDKNNLYNTNDKFDYGGFRALMEAQSQVATSTTLFAYKFTDSGVYAFYLSTDINRKMYVRVMTKDAQCSVSGPFFPTTSSSIVASGIAVNNDILKEPDWAIIFILLAAAFLSLIIMILLLVLFRKYGWSKTSYLFPFYRTATQHYNFDDYASKGSVVYPVKKYHRNLQALTSGHLDLEVTEQAAILDAGAIEVKNDEFWDYDRQVDLEGFSTKKLYDTLSHQSHTVTTSIGQHKDNAKQMYRQIVSQTESLKSLWAAKMNLRGTATHASNEDIASYEHKLHSLELELARRKELGQRFGAILERQAQFFTDDESGRENHQVNFQAPLREALRLLTEHAAKLQCGELASPDGGFHQDLHNDVNHRVALVLEKVSEEITSESKRVAAWGVLGQGMGGQLLVGSSRTPATRDNLFDKSGNVRSSAVVVDEKTGLILPRPGSQMVLADGTVSDIPSGYTVHPQTARVLPIAGNVAFDPITSSLAFVIDSATGEAATTDEIFIPFVPYPINPNTGDPALTRLKPLKNRSDLRYGAPMPDPQCGLLVPILAMTVHPQSGVVLPIGGIHRDPVTSLPVPIEIGSFMTDSVSGQAVPILAVTLDEQTGAVAPVGGTKAGEGTSVPIIPGDSFVDELSSKLKRVHGGVRTSGGAVPSAGGYQSLLDSSALACEARLLDAVREYKDAIYSSGSEGGTVNIHHEENIVETAVKELQKARSRMKSHLLRAHQDIDRRRRRADILATTGGSPGMYEFTKTGQLLPILVGTSMADPAGSGQNVPILGADCNCKSGKVIPLGGTMEDPAGEGLVPIMIGKEAIDPVTGETSPVVGVRLNPESQLVVPVTLASTAHRKPKPPPGAAAKLEEEVAARRGFWRRQRLREQELAQKEQELALTMMFNLDTVSSTQAQKSLEEIDSAVSYLHDTVRQEVQRRGAAQQDYTTVIPADVVAIIVAGDKTENEREDSHTAANVRFSEVVRKFYAKMHQEEKRYRDRMADLQGAMNPEAENSVLERHKQAKIRLQTELRDQLRARMEGVDEQHSALEYIREFSELCLTEAKVVLARSALLAGDYDSQLVGVYGDVDSSGDQDSELIPLIRQLIALLESGGPFYLSSELLNFLQQGPAGGSQAQITNINIHGQQRLQTNAQQQQLQKEPVKSTLVKSSTAKEDGNGNKEKQLSSSSTVVVIGDMSRLQTSGTQTKLTDKKKYLFEKQAYEAAKLENDLQREETRAMGEVIEDFEKKKHASRQDLANEFSSKLAQAKTEQETEKILLESVQKMTKLNEALEKQKQQQLAKLRDKLLDRRRQQKKGLHVQHIQEAQAEGVGVEEVPDIRIQMHDEMMHNLKLKQQGLEEQSAELKKASCQPLEKLFDKIDDHDYMRILRDLGVDRPSTADVLRKLSDRRMAGQRLSAMLQNRKGRLQASRLSEEEHQLLSEEEKQRLLHIRDAQNEADCSSEESALMAAWREREKEWLKQEQEEALREILKSVSESERDRILHAYHDKTRELERKKESEQWRQQDKLVAKLAARKRLHERLDRDKAVNKELDHITKTHAARCNSDVAEVINSISTRLNGEDLTPEQQALVEQQLERQEGLELQHLQQRRAADRELEEELAGQQRLLDDQIRHQQKLVIDSHQAKFDREVLLHGDKLTEEEHQKLLTKHKQEQEALKKNLESERLRQSSSLRDKLSDQHQERIQLLMEKQEAEMEEESIRLQRERDKLNEELACQVESSMLKDSVAGKEGEKAENIIYTILRQRHMKEAIHLEEQLARARDTSLKQRLADIEIKRQEGRSKLLSAFEQELLELVGNAGSMSQDELTAKKNNLRLIQEKQLKDFDELTSDLIEQTKKEISPELEIEDTYARLELKEKQLRELAEAMNSYCPIKELQKKYDKDAKRSEEEAEKYKTDVLRKMKQELEKRRNEQKTREEERKNKILAQLKLLEKDLEEEHMREVERQRERAAEKERLRQQQLAERDHAQREEIAAANISREEKERLLKEHERNIAKLEEGIQQDQIRSQMSLTAKLEARRHRHQQAEVARLVKKEQLDADNELRNELHQKQRQESLQGSSLHDSAGGSAWQRENSRDVAHQLTGFSSSGNMEQDWINLLMASPLFKQINDLEEMLSQPQLSASVDVSGCTEQIQGADYSKPYLDVKDAQWVCKGDLAPTDTGSISPSQFVVYRFGVFLVRMLHQSIGTPEVTLLLASNLPPNNYHNNAFRNSVFYQHASKILFVRQERMKSIGEFAMVILHSLAHIKAGDMTDDANVLFLRVFYKAMKEVCQDMFFSRTRGSHVSQHLAAPATHLRAVLQQALTSTLPPDDRINAINELVDLRVESSMRLDFSDQKMSQRLQGYEAAATNARLRQSLAAKGGYLASGDFIHSRMAELRGSCSQTPSSPRRRQKMAIAQSPRNLLDAQVVSLRHMSDAVSAEVMEVLKLESDLREGLKAANSSADSEKSRLLQEQLSQTLLRKEEVLKQSAHLEDEIRQKEKALKSHRK